MPLMWTTSRQERPRPVGSTFRVVWRVLVIASAFATLPGCTLPEDGPDAGPSPVFTSSAPSSSSVAGTWTGTYRIVECAQRDGGPLMNMCTSLGVTYPFTLELQQQGAVVTGRYALANVWFDLGPSQITDDRATLHGAGRIDSAGVQVDVIWSLSVARPAIGGTAVLEWTADAGGAATLRATLVGQVAN